MVDTKKDKYNSLVKELLALRDEMKTKHGESIILHCLASMDGTEYFPLIDSILRDGENINARFKGFTPLHIAAMMGNQDMVVFLLKRGANPLLKCKGMTLRDIADNDDIKKILKKAEERFIMFGGAFFASAALISGIEVYLFTSGIVAVGAINIILAVMAVATVAYAASSVTYELLKPNYEVETVVGVKQVTPDSVYKK